MKRIDLYEMTGFPSSLTWDAEARAFYLGVGGPVEETVIGDTGYVNVDLDAMGHLAGIEVLVNTEEMEPRT